MMRGTSVLFDLKSSWAGSTGVALRCFATGQGSCGGVSQTCSPAPEATVLGNTIGGPLAIGDRGHVCDVGWSSCSYCVDWSSLRTDSSAGSSGANATRYLGDSSISATDTVTHYWIR
jgi:hypothetical protein